MHEKIHNNEKSFQCNICDEQFLQSKDLLAHNSIHSGIKAFECNTCGKTFATLSRVNDHEMKVHSGKKPFECKVCEKKFGLKGDLQNHMKTRIHLNEMKKNSNVLGNPSFISYMIECYPLSSTSKQKLSY